MRSGAVSTWECFSACFTAELVSSRWRFRQTGRSMGRPAPSPLAILETTLEEQVYRVVPGPDALEVLLRCILLGAKAVPY